MYMVTGKITKQNIEDSFFTISDSMTSPEVRQYWVENYKNTGKCIFIDIAISSDQLVMDTTQMWLDQASYEEYKNDTVLQAGLFSLREAYWADHGITGVIVSEEAI